MPLHLLGKKSWNVYNQDNVERVKRDEERAQADQQEREKAERDHDAADRLALLRGQPVADRDEQFQSRPTKRRRLSHDDATVAADRKHARPDKDSREKERMNETSESLDKISNMRFRDAAGRSDAARKPWYSNLQRAEQQTVGKDVWGNEDAGRQARDQARLSSSDPLMAMKRGVKQLKETEKQKAEWRKERESDLTGIEELARKERKHRHRRHRSRDRSRSRDRERRHRHHKHRRRSRSPDC